MFAVNTTGYSGGMPQDFFESPNHGARKGDIGAYAHEIDSVVLEQNPVDTATLHPDGKLYYFAGWVINGLLDDLKEVNPERFTDATINAQRIPPDSRENVADSLSAWPSSKSHIRTHVTLGLPGVKPGSKAKEGLYFPRNTAPKGSLPIQVQRTRKASPTHEYFRHSDLRHMKPYTAAVHDPTIEPYGNSPDTTLYVVEFLAKVRSSVDKDPPVLVVPDAEKFSRVTV